MGMINKVKDYMAKPYSKGDYYAGIAGVVLLYGGLATAWVIQRKIAEKREEKKFEPACEIMANPDEVCEAVGNVEEEEEA